MFGGFFDVPRKRERLQQIEDQISLDPDFWNDPKASAPLLKEKKLLSIFSERADKLLQLKDDLEAALSLAKESEEFFAECENTAKMLEEQLNDLEIQSLLSDEQDGNDAIITINAGAGGTESCDWAAMLLRMFLRYAERKGWQATIYDEIAGDGAGIKSVTVEIKGEFAFGLLKAEIGVHRLVRISPFDANARRHTSFASVFVIPVVDENVDIDINPADLRIDTFRAGGAGGQHINKTDSAVRITHVPTGIVVQSQTQRSQHQNKDAAMGLLRSKLYEKEMEKRQQAKNELENTKEDNSWGSQIRSYVLAPYKLVKDHRTDIESFNPTEVLDGGIDMFIHAFLVNKVRAHQS